MEFKSGGNPFAMGQKGFDTIYCRLVSYIYEYGHDQKANEVRAKYLDGVPATTKFIEAASFTIRPDESPLLQTKFVAVKSAATEIEWIWQEMSNKVKWLQDRNVKIWNEWERSDGTIGKAYGYQLANKSPGVKLNQVKNVINQLINNPGSRRIMTSLWGVNDLDDMALQPCVWATNWKVVGGKLSLHVKQRSADVALGLPFNVYQYSLLHRLMAETVGLELGNMYWSIDDAHIYHRHMNNLMRQVQQDVSKELPIIKLPGEAGDNFFDRRLSGVVVENYKHNGKFKFEIAE